MAGRDYIRCSKCDTKLIYDGDDRIRESLEDRWGNPDCSTWTVKMLCPGCVKELQAEVEQLRHAQKIDPAALMQVQNQLSNSLKTA